MEATCDFTKPLHGAQPHEATVPNTDPGDCQINNSRSRYGQRCVPRIHASINARTIAEADRGEIFSLIEQKIVSLHGSRFAQRVSSVEGIRVSEAEIRWQEGCSRGAM